MKQVNVRMPELLHQKLKYQAKKQGVSLSDLVRSTLEKSYNKRIAEDHQTVYQEQITYLKDQVKEKDKQLQAKDTQLAQLHERLATQQTLLDQEQQLHRHLQNQVQLEENTEKRKWWHVFKS